VKAGDGIIVDLSLPISDAFMLDRIWRSFSDQNNSNNHDKSTVV
jgi:hypothetical protein